MVQDGSDIMRIGFFGGGSQALATISALAARPDFEIAFIHPRDAGDTDLRALADARDIDLMPVRDINAPDGLGYVQSKSIDLILSINCKRLFKRPLLQIPRFGAVNVHNGLLPRQRGGGGAYVGIINHEPCGMTIHFIDDGIDTGDIIAQHVVNTHPDITMGELQQQILDITPNAVLDALVQVKRGSVVAKPQRDAPYYYVPKKPEWDEFIDWSLPTSEILDRIRARTPGPDSFFVLGRRIVFVLAVAPEPKLLAHRNAPGQVLETSPAKGVLVKTGDTGIWITRIRYADGDLQSVPDFPVGTMLGQNVHLKLYELEARLETLEDRMRSK